MNSQAGELYEGIAVVGLAGRMPGAGSVQAFWRNLINGTESITFFTEEELIAAGLDPALAANPNYIKARGILGNIEYFDAFFFGHSPRAAELMDPQHRVFLECAWEALENAGYDSERYQGRIGVFAGQSMNTYMITNILHHLDLVASVDSLQAAIGNDKDSLTTEVAYKLNLKGPAVTIQSSSSTSLTAVHYACQSLLNCECDMALAGGVSIHCPEKAGYMFSEGGTTSRDGHCRAFDAKAQGFVSGHGAGVVVLKRLEDAVADGDCIYAVIKGSAVNNDGANKVSYMAPSVDGQAEVVALAQAIAGVEAESISYIETHGTGTAMGDPIEIAALTQAFRLSTDKLGFCAVGSAKTNIGHLDSAAGVVGLIKAVLALAFKQIPATLHFEKPNPRIDFKSSPFYVNTKLTPWESKGAPRRAGVTSLGMGGTNAHVILEEAPLPGASAAAFRPWQILPMSAKTSSALDRIAADLAAHLRENPGLNAADVAYTFQVGRRAFNHRRFLICQDPADAAAILERLDPERAPAAESAGGDRPVAFMFSGQGAQHVRMAAGLYQTEPVFREQVDLCAALLQPHLDLDLRELLYPDDARAEQAAEALNQTRLTQPALFTLEYALAKLWMSWGVTPQAMIGHSIGEYVAACLAGVFALEDALALVAARGRLMQDLPPGAMLAVPLPEEKVAAAIKDRTLSLAAVNAPALCVVSGPMDVVHAYQEELAKTGVTGRPLHTSHAFHSAMMEPILAAFTALVGQVRLHPPQLPYVSNVTGTWITAAEATDPHYWARHLRGTVRFADGVGQLLHEPNRVLLEIGPGITLGSLARQHGDRAVTQAVVTSLGHPQDKQPDTALIATALGRLWLAGVEIDWFAYQAAAARRRVPLPTYPFERQRYWLDPPRGVSQLASARTQRRKKPDVAEWLYRPAWERAALSVPRDDAGTAAKHWLILADELGLGEDLARRLGSQGAQAVLVKAGDRYERSAEDAFTIDPGQRDHYARLLGELHASGRAPAQVVHAWGVTGTTAAPAGESFARMQDRGFFSLLHLVQALGARDVSTPVRIVTVTDSLQRVTGREEICPAKATVLAPCRIAPQEYPQIACRSIDLDVETARESLADQVLAEALTTSAESEVAYRDGERFVRTYPAAAPDAAPKPRLREGGVYLITGGLGRVGLDFAEHLARTVKARLMLVGRSGLPPKEAWPRWLAEGGTGEEDAPVKAGDAGIRERIRRLARMEEMGAEIRLVQADVSDRNQMRAAVEKCLAEFGALHGVIHAAGTIKHVAIHEAAREECLRQFLPKIQGVYALAEALQGRALDFRLLVSSLSTVLGGLGYIAYAAGNAFMDAFAEQSALSDDTAWLSADFEAWQFSGAGGVGATLAEMAMTPAEGVQVLERVLSLDPCPRVVISSGELAPRLAQWTKLAPEQATATPKTAPAPDRTAGAKGAQPAAGGDLERKIAAVWGALLGVERVGLHDNFFDLGGNSLIAIQVASRLSSELQCQIPVTSLFEAPTVSKLAGLLGPASGGATASAPKEPAGTLAVSGKRAAVPEERRDIAIVGLAGRFPGARDVDEFWRNLCDGVESIHFLTDAELDALGVDPARRDDPNYVRARALLDDYERFDASYFGYSHREAEITDPQQRVLLECALECLENAGYDSENYPGAIGVYAGAGINTYLLYNIGSNPRIFGALDPMTISIANNVDLLTTRISYKLNLNGPSQAIQSACSTSLVAVHFASQSLLNGECDLALAGGVCINVNQRTGYRYVKEAMASPDGHCRAFDAKAGGTVFGGGVGLVALKRLADALADGDTIHAVIKGSSVNNDGSHKVGFTAPSVDGQSAVIAEAMAKAGVRAEEITYVETHGTGTHLGDPIEVQALNKVFRAGTDAEGYCAIGSVKTNIGHLEAAAGIAGLIKTALALKHKLIPPNLHYTAPNPEIDFAHSPFFVNTGLTAWTSGRTPRRAGVSSFGIGGTNAHVILEEPPVGMETDAARPYHLLPLSAKTAAGLEKATHNLAAYFRANPATNIADAAFTLQAGRKAHGFRRTLVCRDLADAAQALASLDPGRVFTAGVEPEKRTAAFLFPGQGAQYVNMGRGLYQTEPAFRAQIDRCAELLRPHLGLDLRSVLFPDESQTAAAEERLRQTDLAQPALFAVEFALAALWREWGLEPDVLAGHSLGEYVAACLAGVFDLEDALALVAARGRLLQGLPPGAMVAVTLPPEAIEPLLGEELSLAAVNGPSLGVVSGPVAAVAALESTLGARGVACRRLHTSHAFHSRMVAPIVDAFAREVAKVTLRAPRIPFISNVTGTWITEAEATDPRYWTEHLRRTVRFAETVDLILRDPGRILLEVGPGQTLCTLARQHPDAASRVILTSLRHPQETRPDEETILQTLGRLWLSGARIDWAGFHAHDHRRRLPLPTYPFERQRYWIEAQLPGGMPGDRTLTADTAWLAADRPLETDDILTRRERPALQTAYAAPGTEVEQAVANILQELLGLRELGVHDNLLELGLSSLMATQVASRLRDALQIDLPLRTFFERQTVSELAAAIEQTIIEELERMPEEEAQKLVGEGDGHDSRTE